MAFIDKLTEAKVQSVLWRELQSGAQIVCSNFTPVGWWECDMWSVTRAGYAQEHEIKLTRSDFKADAGKHRSARGVDGGESKYEMLRELDPRCPKQFWYVTPPGLLDPEELPEFAGLKEVVSAWRTVVIKKAPTLNKSKASDRDKDKALQAMYYRYWALKVSATKGGSVL